MAAQTQAGLGDLKQRIDKLLRETNTYSQIRDFIRHQQAENEEGEKNTNGSNSPTGMTAVQSALKEKHVLSQLVKSLRRPPNLADHGGHHSADTHGLSALATPSPFRRFLLLKVQGGRAFVDHTSTDSGSFVLHLHFRNQRFRSRPVPCCLEPAFDESFLMDLQSPGPTKKSSTSNCFLSHQCCGTTWPACCRGWGTKTAVRSWLPKSPVPTNR